jgi:hypothetical protein
LKKSNSCSTIYIDDSTVSQPNLKSAIRLVSCAVHYHIKNRTSDRSLDIFDEKLHPIVVINSKCKFKKKVKNCGHYKYKYNYYYLLFRMTPIYLMNIIR